MVMLRMIMTVSRTICFYSGILVFVIASLLLISKQESSKYSKQSNETNLTRTSMQHTISLSKDNNNINISNYDRDKYLRHAAFNQMIEIRKQRKSASLVNIDIMDGDNTLFESQPKVTTEKYNKTYKGLLQKLHDGRYTICADMFGKKLVIPWDGKQQDREDMFHEMFEEVMLKEMEDARKNNRGNVNLNLEGNSGGFPDQLRLYYEVMQYDFTRTICETGFNAGHSTFMWLNSNPDVHVYSFDLGNHFYARPMAKCLQKMFPGRLSVTFGDSRQTLPVFRRDHPDVKCDLVVIDGGHVGNVPLMDFENFYQMVKPSSDHLVILDDWPNVSETGIDMAAMWINQTELGRVQTVRQCINLGSPKGITFGIFNW